MTTYDLYVESGPMMKKTLVHVPALLGCTGRGDTTPAAIDGATDAIRAYLRFLGRIGEGVDPRAAFTMNVAAHDTAGGFLGTSFLPTDEKPLLERESNALMQRLEALHGELRNVVGELTAKQLDAQPAKGRPIRRILRHICAEGGYLREISGASRMLRQVDEEQIDALDALDQLFVLEVARLRSMSTDERSAVIMRGQSPWSARSAVRRMLEHGWEHYVEIAERLGRVP